MIPYKISEQERTSIIRPVHHSFNVFHARRGAEGGTLVSPKAKLGKGGLREHEARAIASWLPPPMFLPTVPTSSSSPAHTHIHARQDPLTNTFNPYTSTRSIRVHVSSEFGPSLFVFTLHLGLFSSSQPSATPPSLYPSYLSSSPFFSSSPAPEERRPTDLLLLPLSPPAKETESRLQTGVVLIKLLKRTCIQGWFRPECSYVQPHATNVRSKRTLVWALRSVSFRASQVNLPTRDPSWLRIDPILPPPPPSPQLSNGIIFVFRSRWSRFLSFIRVERFSRGEKKLFLPVEKSLPKEEIKILSRTYKQGKEGGREGGGFSGETRVSSERNHYIWRQFKPWIGGRYRPLGILMKGRDLSLAS